MNEAILQLRNYGDFARRYARRFLDERQQERRLPIAAAPHRPVPEVWTDDELTAAWLGHASVLINFHGAWILTDPALMSRVGVRLPGVTTLGPRRLVQPALFVRELPPLDAVLLSHAHMDHTDLPTLRRLPRRTPIVVQQGNRDLVARFRFITELSWSESADISVKAGGTMRVTSVETLHWGARTLSDTWRGYGGYLIERNGRAILFGGDTANTTAFAALRNRAQIELAIMPIGAYDPYIRVHANPEQAWRMTNEMGARYMLPVHHSTFKLSREPQREPLTRLLRAAADERHRIAITEIGETWTMKKR